jgi:hypothetical protein
MEDKIAEQEKIATRPREPEWSKLQFSQSEALSPSASRSLRLMLGQIWL